MVLQECAILLGERLGMHAVASASCHEGDETYGFCFDPNSNPSNPEVAGGIVNRRMPFREFVGSLNKHEKEHLAFAFEKRLHGRAKRAGFEEILGMLSHYKLAKWSLISVVPFYFTPKREAFVKPTTAKGIIAFLEVDDLQYKPTPSWEFYSGYRKLLDAVRKEVHPSLSVNYAALSGFLMTTIPMR